MSKLKISDFFKGDTVVLQLQLLNDDDTPIDILADGPADYVFFLTFKENRDDEDILAPLQLMFELFEEEEALSDGKVDLYLSSDHTNKLPAQRLHWDIQLVYAGETVKTLGYGTVQVKQDVTRADGLGGGGK